MNNRLRKGEICPLHHKRDCCGREVEQGSDRNNGRGERANRPRFASPRFPRKFEPACLRVEDEFVPKGYRELCNDREKKRRKAIKAEEQRDDQGRVLCLLCNEPIDSFRELELCHKESKGMGGAWRDDSLDNLFVGHRGCNREQGSMSLDQFLAKKGTAA